MSDERNKSDSAVSTVYLKDEYKQYPEMAVSCVHFLGDEIQIEQGNGPGAIDMGLGSGNAVVSISKNQALELVDTITKMLSNKE